MPPMKYFWHITYTIINGNNAINVSAHFTLYPPSPFERYEMRLFSESCNVHNDSSPVPRYSNAPE